MKESIYNFRPLEYLSCQYVSVLCLFVCYQQGHTLALANTMKANWWENTRMPVTFSHLTYLQLIFFSELEITQHALLHFTGLQLHRAGLHNAKMHQESSAL